MGMFQGEMYHVDALETHEHGLLCMISSFCNS